MNSRVQELCRQLQPVLGKKIDRLWAAYLVDPDGRPEIEVTLELLALRHLGKSYQPDRAPFPPPPAQFAAQGDLSLGQVLYAQQERGPFRLDSRRLKEHALISGRSGSGKTTLTFALVDGMLKQGLRVLALDWKRGYRDLMQLHSGIQVYTVGRDVAPFRFNPLIPPPGCEPHVWCKLVSDVIARSYLGGEGVVSLLVGGIEKLYTDAGVFDGPVARWPTMLDLLAWLRSAKLRGRPALWQASAERILLAMTYGEFGSVINTQDVTPIQELLHGSAILEMDGLSSSSDRVMFSESLILYLYRSLLERGPRERLEQVIVLEEAHHLLLAKPAGTQESVLENSIRMIRQYGAGFVFVDQSASLISKVAFANSWAMFALSQKLAADVRTMAGAMNLTDEQRDALSTLPVGTAVVRLADEHPEPFLVRVQRPPIREGLITDDLLRARAARAPGSSGDSGGIPPPRNPETPLTPVPGPDKNIKNSIQTDQPPHPHPPPLDMQESDDGPETFPPDQALSREAVRFLADVAARPLSTTVARYERLQLSRRKGNAVRQDLQAADLIVPVPIATRTGQVVLYDLTDAGRGACRELGLGAGPRLHGSLLHEYWIMQAAEHYESQGYEVTREYAVPGDGLVDLRAARPDGTLAIEIETGQSDIRQNIRKLQTASFDKLVLLAVSPEAAVACQRALLAEPQRTLPVELLTWLDVSPTSR